jgi:hypothetical protein
MLQNIIAVPCVARELFGASAAEPERDGTQGDTCGLRHGATCLERSPRQSLFHCNQKRKEKKKTRRWEAFESHHTVVVR